MTEYDYGSGMQIVSWEKLLEMITWIRVPITHLHSLPNICSRQPTKLPRTTEDNQDACNFVGTLLYFLSDIMVTRLLSKAELTVNPDACWLVLFFFFFLFFKRVATSSLGICLLIAPLCQQLQRASSPSTCSVYMLGCYIPRILINDLTAEKERAGTDRWVVARCLQLKMGDARSYILQP